MKNTLLFLIISGLFCCNSQQSNNQSAKKNNLDSLLTLEKEKAKIDIAFKVKSNDFHVEKYAKYSAKYVKINKKDDLPEDSDMVISFLLDKKNKIFFIQELSETEDGNMMINHYFHTQGGLFLDSIESFHFENPCNDNKIRDLTYIKNIYYESSKVLKKEEYLKTDNNSKIPISNCTFNGVTEIKMYNNVESFLKQNPVFPIK